MTSSSKSGQVLLITLLVLAIATTIGLSLIARSTTDLTISREAEESARAFSAAEAGIEESLLSGQSTGVKTLSAGQVTYTASVTAIGGAVGAYTLPQRSVVGETDTVWLINHLADGSLDETTYYTSPTLDVCWAPQTTTPALIVTIPYISGGAYQVAKLALDPDAGSRSPANGFTAAGASGNGCGQSDVYRYTITFATLGIDPATDTLLALRVRPVYSDTQVYVNAPSLALPQQGKRIESVGTTPSGLTRRIVVQQPYLAPSSIFDAVVVSQSGFQH